MSRCSPPLSAYRQRQRGDKMSEWVPETYMSLASVCGLVKHTEISALWWGAAALRPCHHQVDLKEDTKWIQVLWIWAFFLWSFLFFHFPFSSRKHSDSSWNMTHLRWVSVLELMVVDMPVTRGDVEYGWVCEKNPAPVPSSLRDVLSCSTEPGPSFLPLFGCSERSQK